MWRKTFDESLNDEAQKGNRVEVILKQQNQCESNQMKYQMKKKQYEPMTKRNGRGHNIWW